MKQFLFIILFVFLMIIAGVFIFKNKELFSQEIIISELAQVQRPIVEPEKESQEIIVLVVGDIMLDRGVEYMINKYGQGDFKFPFLKIAAFLKESDILFGNLESVISDKGYNVGSAYSFRAEPKAIEALEYAGFDIVSVANNHIFDYSRAAMEDSFERLKSISIEYVGGGFSENEACSPVIKEINGVKIGFLAYTNKGSESWRAGENQSGICWLDKDIEQEIEKARTNIDILIISMHWGEEYQLEPSSEQKYFAHLAINAGADLIIGHHPHVIQPIEQYENGYIAYSLGNFIFDQGFSEETVRGLILKVLIKDKKIQELVSEQVKINDFFQPEIIQESEKIQE